MSEINCGNCTSACCRGNMVVQLTNDEVSFMLRGGNRFLTVAQSADHDREEVLYPVGHETDAETGKIKFLALKGNEYEPLAKGLGRYILKNDCTYLEYDQDGNTYCGVYEDRPALCRDFEMGGAKCQAMRILHGVDSPPSGSVTQITFSETR
jgi:Fe-S-cluster containining protein